MLPEVGRFISAILSSPNFINIGLFISLMFLEVELGSPKKNSVNALLRLRPSVLFLLEEVITEAE
jgi:hypothetical protein